MSFIVVLLLMLVSPQITLAGGGSVIAADYFLPQMGYDPLKEIREDVREKKDIYENFNKKEPGQIVFFDLDYEDRKHIAKVKKYLKKDMEVNDKRNRWRSTRGPRTRRIFGRKPVYEPIIIEEDNFFRKFGTPVGEATLPTNGIARSADGSSQQDGSTSTRTIKADNVQTLRNIRDGSCGGDAGAAAGSDTRVVVNRGGDRRSAADEADDDIEDIADLPTIDLVISDKIEGQVGEMKDILLGLLRENRLATVSYGDETIPLSEQTIASAESLEAFLDALINGLRENRSLRGLSLDLSAMRYRRVRA